MHAAFRRRAAPDQRDRRTRAAGRLRARQPDDRSTRRRSRRTRSAGAEAARAAPVALGCSGESRRSRASARGSSGRARRRPTRVRRRWPKRSSRSLRVGEVAVQTHPGADARGRCTRRTRASDRCEGRVRVAGAARAVAIEVRCDARGDVPARDRTRPVLPARHARASTSCSRKGDRHCCACARIVRRRGRCCSAPMPCVRACAWATTRSTSTASPCRTHWTGEYAALWRGPETLVDVPSPDGRGPAVDWVHAHSARLHRPRDARRGDARRGARLPAIARACRRWRHRAGNAARAFRARPRPPPSHAPWTERRCR